MNTADWYKRVNAAWPDDLPVPTEAQAVNAARRLYRWGTGRTWSGPVKVTSGRRYSWVIHGTLVVNPDRPGTDGGGWFALIHDLSHWLWRRQNPFERPHTKGHARLELRMRNECTRRGWLVAAPPAPPAPAPEPKAAPVVERMERIAERLARWEAKARRATNAIKKLRRQHARCVRAIHNSALTMHHISQTS